MRCTIVIASQFDTNVKTFMNIYYAIRMFVRRCTTISDRIYLHSVLGSIFRCICFDYDRFLFICMNLWLGTWFIFVNILMSVCEFCCCCCKHWWLVECAYRCRMTITTINNDYNVPCRFDSSLCLSSKTFSLTGNVQSAYAIIFIKRVNLFIVSSRPTIRIFWSMHSKNRKNF